MELFHYIELLYKNTFGLSLTPHELIAFDTTSNVLWNVRLPRILLTFMVGAALSVSGAVLQGLFRNPLVDSYILGISSGAAFGASLAIVYTLSFVNLYAFAGGIIAVLITYIIANSNNQLSTITIILSGMIVSGIFIALLTMVQYISNPYKLQAIVQWTMGNLHAASWLGVNPVPDKIILVTCATLMTTTTVAVAGIISFYGLFLPHIVRMLLGADNSKSIPGNIFLGGTFLLIIDSLSRTLFVFEIPIGVFTTILGGGFFIFLLKKNKVNWN